MAAATLASIHCASVCTGAGPRHSLTNTCLLDAKAVLLGTGKRSNAISAQQPQCCWESRGGVRGGGTCLWAALSASTQAHPARWSRLTGMKWPGTNRLISSLLHAAYSLKSLLNDLLPHPTPPPLNLDVLHLLGIQQIFVDLNWIVFSQAFDNVDCHIHNE